MAGIDSTDTCKVPQAARSNANALLAPQHAVKVAKKSPRRSAGRRHGASRAPRAPEGRHTAAAAPLPPRPVRVVPLWPWQPPGSTTDAAAAGRGIAAHQSCPGGRQPARHVQPALRRVRGGRCRPARCVDAAAGPARRPSSLCEAGRSRMVRHVSWHLPASDERGAADGRGGLGRGGEGAGGRKAYRQPPADHARRFFAGGDLVRARHQPLLEVRTASALLRRPRASGPRVLEDGAARTISERSAASRPPLRLRP